MSKIEVLSSHDGGDTGFLNSYFKGWFTCGAEHRLPFGYAHHPNPVSIVTISIATVAIVLAMPFHAMPCQFQFELKKQ